jgi:two-component system response regulator AtoC
MTSAIAHPFNPPQLETANLLNLVMVDDERAIHDVCREIAQSLGFNTMVAESAEHIYRLLDSQAVDVVLLELKLPGAGGLEALHKIKQRRPDVEVVVVTGYAIVQSAVQAMKNGAYDYVTKPFTHRRTEASAEAGCNPLEDENREPHAAREDQVKAGVWQHRRAAPEIEKLYRMIAKAALSNHPVLILEGNGGTIHSLLGSFSE